ncbi:ATP-dependent OLD family endonuclease [Stutzerimonas stutzeri ATCC 14405 = CCUG 16156]|uniref:ATP-dependent nuclease n=1 Tax=Stutzerimonas stutzeri TaxID=316 RepID=UPI0002548FAE|nr:AAA family ATPase [Stutzerimonas stutzeri]EHY78646.1 ATP-dependent OLD family endonuclease [Stutzerimonas stutzeri ATCC 14405 = CCUG 16156]QOZ97605.1 ATP-dependent endonuclease [Stutzerimonas stutzeri]
MSHILENLKITNFRSCKLVEAKLGAFVPLVGYNNAGKSNILSAVEWLFKGKVLSQSEFFDPLVNIEVEGEISGITAQILDGLEEAHRKKIAPYIVNGKIKIKRTQFPDAKKASDVDILIEHPVDGYKKNPTGIWNAIKCLFPEPIRVAAMDNAADDSAKAKSTSTIGKLLAEFCEAVQKNNENRINRHLGAISRRMSASGNKRLPELDAIDTSINKKIEDLFPGISLKLHFDVPTFEEIFKAGTVRVFEQQDVGRDFSAYGHGAQRSIQMALIRHLAEVKKDAESPTTTVLLIDEPELYLHPFAIEQVREALHTLSQHGYQIIFSTHSGQMITAERAQHTLLVRKENHETLIRKRLKDALEVVLPKAQAQAQHLFALTQSNQILFANKVVLTEGTTEIRLLPFIYKEITACTLGQHQVAMVETRSVDNIPKSLRVLNEMDIPAVAIVDLDYAFRGGVSNGFISSTDPALIALKKILARLENNGACTLDGGGLPTKNGVVTASEAFCLLAKEADAVQHIQSLHNQLQAHGIWLWTQGAIESHLNLAGKNEAVWAQFKSEVEADGIEACCHDFASINALVHWIKN